jgi:AcrR family transcriptional regulator
MPILSRPGVIPRATFRNLPPVKRERLIRAAIAEFARHDFADANLDRLARAAGVPKGSLYQYFEGKDALYVFTLREGLSRAISRFEAHLAAAPPDGAFDLLYRSLVFVLELRRRQPDLARLYVRAGLLRTTPGRAAVLPVLVETGTSFTSRLLAMGIAEGSVDGGIDRQAAAFLIDAVAQRFHETVLLGSPGRTRLERPDAFARRLVTFVKGALASGARSEGP